MIKYKERMELRSWLVLSIAQTLYRIIFSLFMLYYMYIYILCILYLLPYKLEFHRTLYMYLVFFHTNINVIIAIISTVYLNVLIYKYANSLPLIYLSSAASQMSGILFNTYVILYNV